MARPVLALLTALALAGGAQAQAPARVEVAGDAVVFEGRIDRAAAARFIDALRDPAVRRLVITSGGGQVSAALDMAEAIAARGLDIDVPTQCLSSCANYIFPAARHKRLGHARAVGWHGNMTHVLYLDRNGRGQWNEEQMEGARWLAQREAQFYERIGVDGFVCWFGKIAPYDVDDYYALSAADMARFGIREVEVAAGQSPPDAPELLTVDAERLERDRPAVPLDR